VLPIPLIALALAGPPADPDAVARYGVGRLARDRGRLPQAAKELETAARADPAAAAPHRDLAAVYHDLGRDAAATREARAALAADPDDVDTARLLGRLLAAAKRPAEAADALDRAAASPRFAGHAPKALGALVERARYRTDAGDAPATAAAWQAVVRFADGRRDALKRDGFTDAEIDRNAADAEERAGKALAAARRFDEAAAAFRRAADRGRASDPAAVARSHWNAATLLAARGDPAAAAGEVEAFLRFRPTGPEPYTRYAELLREAGRGREAVPRLAALADDEKAPAAVRWVLAAERLRVRDVSGHTGFLELCETAADPALFRVLVAAYADAGRPRELLAVADRLFPAADDRPGRKAADVSPAAADRRQAFAAAVADRPAFAPKLVQAAGREAHSGDVWELLGWAAERAGAAAETEAALRAAARQEGGRTFAAFLRLRAHLLTHRRWQAAVDLCDEAAGRLSPGYAAYLKIYPLAELGRELSAEEARQAAGDTAFHTKRERARALGVLGRYAEMKRACDALLAEYDRAEEVRSVRLLLADAYHGLRQPEKAESELRGLIADDPDDPLPLNNLGYNLADQNRGLAEAEEMIRRAVELDRDERARAGDPQAESGVYLDSLGWVRFRRGDLAGARAIFDRAAALPDGSTDPVVWDHLGDVCFRQGDRAAARRAWAAAAERYVGTHQGRQHGRLAEVRRKLAEAE
jgi:Tfp pilus assembly protein PilF